MNNPQIPPDPIDPNYPTGPIQPRNLLEATSPPTSSPTSEATPTPTNLQGFGFEIPEPNFPCEPFPGCAIPTPTPTPLPSPECPDGSFGIPPNCTPNSACYANDAPPAYADIPIVDLCIVNPEHKNCKKTPTPTTTPNPTPTPTTAIIKNVNNNQVTVTKERFTVIDYTGAVTTNTRLSSTRKNYTVRYIHNGKRRGTINSSIRSLCAYRWVSST